jgi:hypothetical protein
MSQSLLSEFQSTPLPDENDPALKLIDEMMLDYWQTYPELYRAVNTKKAKAKLACADTNNTPADDTNAKTKLNQCANDTPFLNWPTRGKALRQKRAEGHRLLRETILTTGSAIVPRTAAHNRKCEHETIEEAQTERAELVAAQLKTWRSLLPGLVCKFAKLPDKRNPEGLKHKVTVLMLFGLFAFILRLKSHREMNTELTGPVIFEQLRSIFPELKTIPHADTLARYLKNLNPQLIETLHINLIKQLIKNKKFKHMLIAGCLPITIDGAQKLYRQGVLEDERWLERKVGKGDTKHTQQYVYVLEANITLKNGLTIPLMSEFLYRAHNELERDDGKQDCELTAFERLAERLKAYFPRLNIILFMDGLFATQTVLGLIHQYQWEAIVRLPKQKLTDFAKQLNAEKSNRVTLPEQPFYRERKQAFFWKNNIIYGYDWELNVNLVGCLERYDIIDQDTAEVITQYSEHAWISTIPITQDNAHELTNLGARKAWLIEHSFNVEKNHGYQYKHLFSRDWFAMQGFHYLMRLGHAINALSEFTKTMKQYIKKLGVNKTLSLIRQTLSNPWLPISWYQEQQTKTPQLRLQLE